MISQNNGYIVSQCVKIHYLARNLEDTTKSALLFVPGVMMPAWIWENQIEYFSKNFRVVAMDPRSQGDSDQATEGHYAYAMAKDIKAVVDELHLESFVLIGWSLGVPEVVNYAAHFANSGLKGLVLVDGLVGMDPNLPFYQKTVEYWTQLQFDRETKTREFIKSIFKKPQSVAYYEKLAQAALRTPTNTVMTLMQNYILQDFRPLLPNIKIPTLVMTVEGPRLDYMKKLPKLLPNARIEIIDDAAHTLFVDQPEVFNKILEGFVLSL